MFVTRLLQERATLSRFFELSLLRRMFSLLSLGCVSSVCFSQSGWMDAKSGESAKRKDTDVSQCQEEDECDVRAVFQS
jgi:hypothetical protein